MNGMPFIHLSEARWGALHFEGRSASLAADQATLVNAFYSMSFVLVTKK